MLSVYKVSGSLMSILTYYLIESSQGQLNISSHLQMRKLRIRKLTHLLQVTTRLKDTLTP